MMSLAEYLAETMRDPWNWGTVDCCTFGADWLVARGAGDPMAFIRGGYDSQLSAMRRIAEGGGLVALWTRGMSDLGRRPTRALRIGNVAVIAAPTEGEGPDEACAIYGGSRWLSRSQRGLEAGPAQVLRMWGAR